VSRRRRRLPAGACELYLEAESSGRNLRVMRICRTVSVPQSRSIDALSLPGGRWAVGKHLRSTRSELNYVMTLPKPLQHRELKHVMALPKSLLSGNICAVNKTTSCHCLNLCSATQTSLVTVAQNRACVCPQLREHIAKSKLKEGIALPKHVSAARTPR
jgi:hypothetical protein